MKSKAHHPALLFLAASAAFRLGTPARADDPLPEYRTIPAETNPTPAGTDRPASAYRTWTVSHGDAGSRRYSALDQINRSNVKSLQQAWIYHCGEIGPIQCNPIIVDGVLYGPTPQHALVAVDAATGREKWRFNLEKPKEIGHQNAPARRGLVYWPGDSRHGPRIVFACDFWLYALDPATGQPIADFGRNGRTPFPTGVSAVGCIWKGTYIAAGVLGDFYSFDLGTGRQLWRFHTIPHPGEFGGDTWRGQVNQEGGNCWGGICLDDQRGIVFAGIGNPWPSYNGTRRLGDNLFSDCLLALDARTGRRLWHFQNVRHDVWDLDNPAPPNLVTITRNGRRIDAVACEAKLGDTLLFDRVTGRPIFPIRLRRAPKSDFPGEVTADYQPYPELPEPISDEEFKADDITNRSPAAHAFVERIVSQCKLGWFEPPSPNHPMLFHSSRGGAEWTGACIDVPTGRLYVSSNHIANLVQMVRVGEAEDNTDLPPTAGRKVYLQFCSGCHMPSRHGGGLAPTLIGIRTKMTDADVIRLLKTGRNSMPPAPLLTEQQRSDLLDYIMRRHQPAPAPHAGPGVDEFTETGGFLNDPDGYPGVKPPWGFLNCLDLNTGKLIWRVVLGEYDALTKEGMPKTGTENFGGPTVTAGGLVFCGGTRDSKFRAFDKDTGEELWSAKLPWGGYAPPAVYEVNGKEYVVIAVAGGGVPGLKTGSTPLGDAYVAFALP